MSELINDIRDKQSYTELLDFFRGVAAGAEQPLAAPVATPEELYDNEPYSEEVAMSSTGMDCTLHIQVAERHHEERIRRGEQ